MQAADDKADRPHGMWASEIKMLCQLVREFGCRRILEIGMANGSSTVELLRTLKDTGGGHVVSIDPFQYSDAGHFGEEYNIRGQGMENVKECGLSDMHQLVNDFDYIALPQLVRENYHFDLVFIDGYHSFDFTLLDFFYADLLLENDGICTFHDTCYPAVNKVLQFVLRNKPYKLLGPRPLVYSPHLPKRIARKARMIITGQARQMRERRTKWHSLAAVQKLETTICPQLKISNF